MAPWTLDPAAVALEKADTHEPSAGHSPYCRLASTLNRRQTQSRRGEAQAKRREPSWQQSLPVVCIMMMWGEVR